MADPDDEPRHAPSLVDAAYSAVRQAVLRGELRPGERVTVRPFAEALGVSPTPVKAALTVLEREGFLVARPNAGFFVAELSAADMRDVYELRAALDALACRDVARRRPTATLDTMRELLARQREALAAGDVPAYADLDRRFHATIWEGAANRRLAPIADLLAAQLRLGQNVTISVVGRPEASLEEHADVLEAIEAGDTAAAEQAARRHVDQVLRALRRALSR